MKKKENRKIRYSKMVIRDSLMELMKTKSILSISVKDICDLADISRSTFYDHYKDQYELLRQIEEEILVYFDDMLSRYKDKHSKPETTRMLEEMLTYVTNNSNTIQVMLGENGNIAFQKKLVYHFIMHDDIRKYFSESQPDDEVKTYYSVFVVHGAIGLLQHWLKNDMAIPVHQLAKMLIKWTEQQRKL
jgi:AcrR family transcriptional regulator